MTFFLTGKGLIQKHCTNLMPSKIKKNLDVPTFQAYFM